MRELEAKEIKIDKVIARIEIGDIKIPAFQRGYIWNQGQVVDLLDSIYKDYPIGSLLFWESKEPLKSTRNVAGIHIPERDPEYPTNYVLDGQQRLSTLYAVFRHGHKNIEFEKEGIGIPNHNIFDIYFDLDEEVFVHFKELPKYLRKGIGVRQLSIFDNNKNRAFIKLSHILDIGKIVEATNKLGEDQKNKAMQLFSKFINYEIPIVTVKGRSKQEVGIIFERINNTGSPLTTVDLMTAWTWNDDFNLRGELNAIRELLSDKGFDGITDRIVLQTISAVVYNKITTEDILLLDANLIKSKISKIRESFEQSIDFLYTHLNVMSNDFIPNNQQIIPIVYFYTHIKIPNTGQISALSNWFWRTSFSNRYKFATSVKVSDDIQIIKAIIN